MSGAALQGQNLDIVGLEMPGIPPRPPADVPLLHHATCAPAGTLQE